ncbi:MAG TPA: hypothetical protein VG754_03235, partial [Verrucomicrobiae bacterium]|nr:hypothetical protein [Verrucomicrobiae bacterium]
QRWLFDVFECAVWPRLDQKSWITSFLSNNESRLVKPLLRHVNAHGSACFLIRWDNHSTKKDKKIG